jgi:hypothetical protein
VRVSPHDPRTVRCRMPSLGDIGPEVPAKDKRTDSRMAASGPRRSCRIEVSMHHGLAGPYFPFASSLVAASREHAMDSFADPRNRRWKQPIDQELPATARWAASLPMEVQPLALLQRIPRIANALAHVWDDHSGRLRYLDDLLVDRRGGRRGFPPDIHQELLMLREYCEGRYPLGSSTG